MKTSAAKLILTNFACLALLCAGSLEASASAQVCTEIFAAEKMEILKKSLHEISALRISLDQAKASGSATVALTALSMDIGQRELQMVQFVEKNNLMTREELREKMRSEIRNLQKQKIQDQEGQRLTEDENSRRKEQQERVIRAVRLGQKAIMHRVQPGTFKMGESGKQVNITISEPFEMLATPTTQAIWKSVAEIANRRLQANIDPDPSMFKGVSRPVENVYDQQIRTWLAALNELSLLGEKALHEIIPDHKAGDYYRLPTEAEWEFVAKGRGQNNEKYYFGDSSALVNDYGWSNTNAQRETHPVALKRPFIVDGHEFYDMYGNVWERVLEGTGQPGRGPDRFMAMTKRGGSYGVHPNAISSHLSFPDSTSTKAENGFRFIREGHE